MHRHVFVIREATCPVDEGVAVDVVFMGFSNAFDAVLHTTFIWTSCPAVG